MKDLSITAGEVEDATPALRICCGREDLPALIQYRLAHLAEQVMPIGRAFAKGKNAAIREHALKDEAGFVWATDDGGRPQEGSYQLDPARREAYEEAIDQLRAQRHVIQWAPLDARLLEDESGSIPGGAFVLNDLRPFLDFSSYEAELAGGTP